MSRKVCAPFAFTFSSVQRWGILDKVNQSKSVFEPYADQIDYAYFNMSFNFNNLDTFSEQENNEIEDGITDKDLIIITNTTKTSIMILLL